MKKGDYAQVKVKKQLHISGKTEKKGYSCRLLQYDDKTEHIFFVLETGELEELSLDAIYDCEIQGEKELVKCSGRLRERYHDEHGKILKIKVENGFYKINLKCVDK